MSAARGDRRAAPRRGHDPRPARGTSGDGAGLFGEDPLTTERNPHVASDPRYARDMQSLLRIGAVAGVARLATAILVEC